MGRADVVQDGTGAAYGNNLGPNGGGAAYAPRTRRSWTRRGIEGLAIFLMISAGIGMILTQHYKLDNGGGCYLSKYLSSSYCNYSYVVAAVGLLVALLAGLLQFLTCDFCHTGLGLIFDQLVAIFVVAWWSAACIIMTIEALRANGDQPGNGWRWLYMAFLWLGTFAAWKYALTAAASLATCCRGRRRTGDIEAGTGAYGTNTGYNNTVQSTGYNTNVPGTGYSNNVAVTGYSNNTPATGYNNGGTGAAGTGTVFNNGAGQGRMVVTDANYSAPPAAARVQPGY